MKKIFIVILLFFFVSILHSEKRIENIKITNCGYYKINIYLNETAQYDIKVSNNVCKLLLKDFIISKNFPGSEFGIESSFLKKIYLTRNDSLGIIFNFSLCEGAQYIVQNYEKSSIIEVSIFSDKLLNESDRSFFKGLKYEVEGEKEKALLEYRKLISTNPKHSAALFHAGLIRKSLGYNYQSKSNLQQVKKNGDNSAEISCELYDVYSLLGEEKNSKDELKIYQDLLEKERSEKYDSSYAVLLSKDINSIKNESDFAYHTNTDTNAVMLKSKAQERKIIKTIPVNTNSYYYSIGANVLIALVAAGSVFYIWRLVIKRRKKQNEAMRKKKVKIDMLENVYQNPEPSFKKMVSSYNKELDSISDSNFESQKNISVEKNTRNSALSDIKSSQSENDIDRLARKYHVERGKIELALKIIAKNDTESARDKYMLLMKMLKENMSLEELASDLRIPRGELDLVMNLKNI